jgi:RNA polymerase sigma-70 factor (ECF subfamily)
LDYTAITPTELVLTCLRTDDESAWTEFVRRFHPLISAVVIRVARRWGEGSPAVMDDLVQETYLKLCSDRNIILNTFKTQEPEAVFGFVKVFTANLVHDHFKALNSRKRGRRITSSLIEGEPGERFEPAFLESEVLERAILMSQIDDALKSKDLGPNAERDRRIFWLYYRVGLPCSAIAALPKVKLTVKGVESTLVRLTRYVRERLIEPTRGIQRGRDSEKGISQDESLFGE